MASAAAPSHAWNSERSVAGRNNPWAIVAIISLPTFMEVLDTSIANVSLNEIAGGLSITLDQATWVLTSYLVANAIIIPISGWLSDVIGRKRYFMISVALFTIASFLCGIAPNLQFLVIARILQGIGGGGLAPVEQSMLADTFPPEKRGMAFATFAIVVVVGPVLGPTLGGFITDTASWHWIFLINVPVGIASLVLTQLFVDEPQILIDERKARHRRGIRIDYIGFALVAAGLGFLELTLDRGEREAWFDSSFILTTALVSAVALVGLVAWEWRHKDPIVDIKLFRNRNFAITNLIMFTTGMILFGTTQLIPQMLQQVLGYSATDAGLALTVGGIATLLAVPIAGRLTDKVDVRMLLFPALIVQGLALYNLSLLNSHIAFMDAAVARMYQSVALPFLFVPINAAAYVGLPQRATAQASSLLNVSRNLGGTVGISAAQTLLANYRQVEQSRLVEGLNPLNPNYVEWMNRAAAMVGESMEARMAVLYQIVQQQAAMLSFLDTFHTFMLFVFVVSPVALFLKSKRGAKAPAGAH
ncbi:DHA2 family efflux MFS transporter permease subunit [Stakelama saccharophila]|uniref:DHA2 family efflux MFS transporter permease subunit n=1 Tax=Stakelama saccharophila TaxID=3075605 RepID=A0ABZ0BCQ9_9SPHN|nr:DHA2 family efflux MFS transporter permease subunit [Stakelama sp. W311]WNO55068.1 DHA2 family efflux MFS transporter permease subunit [Stakelama sp. W311]